MRRLALLPAVMALLLLALRPMTAQPDDTIRLLLRAPVSIMSGAPWSIDVQLSGTEGGPAGESVRVLLLSGLTQRSHTLITGTGGVARWELPADAITASGDTLIIARAGTAEVQRRVRVRPGAPASIDLLTTVNALPAYGEGEGTLIALLRDSFGNPARMAARAHVVLTFPDGERFEYLLPHRAGLVWMAFTSHGEPGRVRVRATADNPIIGDDGPTAALEVRQMPGPPAAVTLSIAPRCAAPDGRDVIRLQAAAVDAHGYPVVDGTLIRFDFGSGFALGRTAGGSAAISLPAPAMLGQMRITAASAGAVSLPAVLRITAGSCR